VNRPYTHAYTVIQKLPFLNAAFILLGPLSEHLAQMLPLVAVQQLPAAFWDKTTWH
jgi:hypothetical protein